jgi:PAS domain S-box-containing protein
MENHLSAKIRIFILLIALGVLISLAIAWFVSGILVRNILKLRKTMDVAAAGNLSVRSEVKSSDQIGELAKNFNSMLERLTHTEDYIANILKTAPIMLLVTDETGKINRINVAALRALGYQETEILGQRVERFLASSAPAGTLTDWLKRLSATHLAGENKIENIRSVLKTKNGETVPVVLSVGIVDGTESPRGFVFAAKDLRELAEYARQRLAKITPVLQKVSTGDFSQQLEVSKDKDEFTEHLIALNATISNLKELYDEIKQKTHELEAQNKKLEQTRVELEAARSNLEEKVAARTKELESAKETLEQKVAERTEELLKLNEKLEQEVAARTGDLQSKLSELESFNKLMVGREIEMVKLKEELADLKKSLKS